MKKIEDYLKHYIGCKVQTPDGIGTLVGLPGDPMLHHRIVNVHFGHMVKTKNSCDGGYDKTRNYGSYLVHSEHLVPIACSDDCMDEINLTGGIKLLLRPLSSMTDEECLEFAAIIGGASHLSEETVIAQARMLLTERLHRQTNISGHDWILATKYFLSKGFDVFDLIEEGIALDSTKN